MKKGLSMVLVVLLLLTSMAGCGSSKSAGDSDSTAASVNEKVELDYWTISTGKDKHAQYAIEQYKKAHPNVTINLVVNSVDDHKKNLKIAASSGSMPSMWFNWGGSLASFYSENDLTYDLTNLVKEKGWNDLYNKTALDMCTFDGKISGLPQTIAMFGMVYRKDLFEKAGITAAPATYAEFEDDLAKLKATGTIPFASGGKGGWHVFRLLELLLEKNLGSEKHDQLLNMNTDIWLDEGVTKTFTEFKKYVDAGYYPDGFATQDPNDAKMLMYNDLAAMTVDGVNIVNLMMADGRDVAGQYGFFAVPLSEAGNRMTTYVQMNQFSNKLSDTDIETALDFNDFMFSPDVVKAMSSVVQQPVPRTDNVIPADLPLAQDMMDALTERGGFLITDQGLPQEVVTKLFEMQDAVLTGHTKPEDAGPAMKKVADDYLATNS